jgi:hypothetical protein
VEATSDRRASAASKKCGGAEVDRLQRKLSALSAGDRESAEAISADVIGALARMPAALASAHHAPTLESVVSLFGLDVSSSHSAGVDQ